MPALHAYIVAQGSYSDPDLTGETWQTGVRALLTTAGEREPVGNLPTDLSPVASVISDSGIGWTAQSNFYIEAGVTDFDPVSYLVDYAMPAWTTWLDQTTFSSLVQLNSILLYPIGSTGLVVPAPPYAVGSPARLDFSGSLPVGGGTGQVMPLQVSIVASHRTPQTGRRGRGRSFLPGIASSGGTFDGSGLVSPTTVGVVRDAQVALLEGLKRDSDPVYVAPAIIGAPWTQYALINQVRVGNVFDTQRRRRRSIVESFEDAPVDNA